MKAPNAVPVAKITSTQIWDVLEDQEVTPCVVPISDWQFWRLEAGGARYVCVVQDPLAESVEDPNSWRSLRAATVLVSFSKLGELNVSEPEFK